MTMDDSCCLGCGRPAAYTFKNTETGYQDEGDDATMKRRQELADASRHKLEGYRIPQRTVDGP
jgi:hypothetical protein